MTGAPPRPYRTWRDLLGLGLVAAALYLPFLGARDLWNPNEPIYGLAVVEMAAKGEWLLPTVNGEPFAEKPILWFWAARVASVALGPGEAALRLPAALAGVAGVLLVYLLVAGYAERGRARIAAMLYGTTYIVFWSARTAGMDLLLAVAALASIVAATRVLDGKLAPWPGWTLAGLAAGLGFLLKGPVALAVAGLPVAAYAFSIGRGRRLFAPPVVAALIACGVVVTPWLLALAARGEGRALHELLIRQNLQRAVAPWDHEGPWWYYLREFWTDMAPWALFVPLAAGLAHRDDRERQLDRLAWLWIAAVILLFSIPASKRSLYILPLAPAVAVLVSGLAERVVRRQAGALRSGLALGLLALHGVVLIAGAVWGLLRGLDTWPEVANAGRVAALAALAWGVATLVALVPERRRPSAAPATFVAGLAMFYFVAGAVVLPAVDAYKSPRAFCERVNALVPAGEPLHAYRIWKWRAGYAYYTDRAITRLTSAAELAERWGAEPPFFVLVEQGRLDEFRATAGESPPLVEAGVGSNRVYLFSNR